MPFADDTFDSVVATLVFCSVTDPQRGLREILRVLKPGGLLYMVEHVRAQGVIAARLQYDHANNQACLGQLSLESRYRSYCCRGGVSE